MDNFKRAWRLTVLNGKHKIIILGLISAVYFNGMMIFANSLVPDKWQIKLGMVFMSLGLPLMIGNADLTGHCRAVMTSRMRTYIYGKFYSVLTLLAIFIMYAAEFTALYIAAIVGMSDMKFAGEESIMTAFFLCIGTVNAGLLFCGKYGCIAAAASTAMAAAYALGYAAFPVEIPAQLSEQPLLCFIFGSIFILIGAAVQYFIRKKSYNKRSYPWGKNMPEEMAELLGK